MPVPHDHDGCVTCEYDRKHNQITIHYASFDQEPYLAENGERSEHPGTPDDGPSKWFDPRPDFDTEIRVS